MKMNRRKFWLLFFSLCFLTVFPSIPQAHASFGKGPGEKFIRGWAYVFTAPFQIPKEVIQAAGKAEPVYLAPFNGMTVGFGSGLYQAGRQMIAGFADVFTFWTPAGRDWAPLYEPATLFPEI